MKKESKILKVAERLSSYTAYITVAIFGFLFGVMVTVLPEKVDTLVLENQALKTKIAINKTEKYAEQADEAVLGIKNSSYGKILLENRGRGILALYYIPSSINSNLIGYDLAISVLSGKISSVNCVEGVDCIENKVEGDNISIVGLVAIDKEIKLTEKNLIATMTFDTKSTDEYTILRVEDSSEIINSVTVKNDLEKEIILAVEN